MDYETHIEEAFIGLLREKAYDKISVSELCRCAKVSRKIFYGHFRDKRSIVEHLFNKHAIEPTRRLNDIFNAQDLNHMGEVVRNRFYEGIYAEKEYYINLAQGAEKSDSVFVDVVTSALDEWNRELFSRLGVALAPEKFSYICYFYAAAQAMLLQRWINDGMMMPPAQIASLFYEITGGYLGELAGTKLKD